MSELFSAVTSLIEVVTEVPAGSLRPESRFDELGRWTSYAALRLLTGIEEQFGIQLDLRTYFAIEDVGGLVGAIEHAA